MMDSQVQTRFNYTFLVVQIQTFLYTCGHKKVLPRRSACKVGRLHSGICGAKERN